MKRFLLAAVVFCATASPMMGTDNPKLSVRLRSPRTSYSLRGSIKLEIVRENTGDESLLVPRWWGWGVMRTDIQVFDTSGHEVTTDFIADELPPPPQPYDFILLEPGEFLGTRLKADAKEFVNKPGDYDFVVKYTSYLAEHHAREVMKMPNAPFWSEERGSVTSNRIRLHITQ